MTMHEKLQQDTGYCTINQLKREGFGKSDVDTELWLRGEGEWRFREDLVLS